MTSFKAQVARIALLSLLLALVPLAAQAQQVLGTIQGTVTDADGAALPGTSVEVTNVDTGAVRTVFTDANGRFRARSLASGNYSVTASLEGFQTTRQEGVKLLVAQTLDVDLALGIEEVSEVITVTSDAPLVETSRSSAASYVSEEEIESLPISGRDFKEFAFLTPTVQNDDSRGFMTMSGQRGIYTGLNIDGTSAKSAFFGYGRGGEATENDGLVVAQDSVKEFQVIVNGFAPEYGSNLGGYVNVVTQSGTNDLRGTGFYFFRDDSLAEDLPGTPLDDFRGRDGSREVDEFDRKNYGLSLGGPIAKDKTHFFVSFDQTDRTQPTTDTLFTVGAYDAILQRAQTEPGFANLVEGYTRNPDGTATGRFLREVENTILFGKLDHQFSDSFSGSFRINSTDYQRLSSRKDEESNKTEKTNSVVAALVSLHGDSGVNEFRAQYAKDDLDRLSQRVGEPIEALIRFRFGNRDQVGKFDFLPIFVEEEKLQIQDNFSYLFGEHDMKFGVDYQKDDLSQLFAGSADGRYDFRSLEDFLNNEDAGARIYFGSVTNPNYDEAQEVLGIYAQDAWRVSDELTVNYGVRYGATYNPDNLEHIFAEGRNIPDDTNNWAPRFGFAYTPGSSGRDVIRGGVGLFFGRTPSLLFASQIQQNGLYPNFGRVFVRPGQVGHVPLGQPIDNENPPANAPNSPAYVDPSFEDAETWRLNIGYERELGNGWSAGVDGIYAEGENLQSNVELNRVDPELDEFGRPNYSGDRIFDEFNEIFVRQSLGESEYKAITLKTEKRWNGKYQVRAHYTWSEDLDHDSNERSATGVTIENPLDIDYQWGLSDRDIENRFVLSGMVEIGWGVRLSGIFEWRSGSVWTAVDGDADFGYCGGFDLGFNCPDTRAVINGQVVERNSFRNEDVTRFDLRLSKGIDIGDWDVDLFVEAFNVFDENYFRVSSFGQRDATSDTFGIADSLATTPRQIQIGARVSFR